ncbi:Periplasmic aromatic aldehyde oxidoreductase [Amycolatopsis camponoti]|uniref:Periplasmic aromatic aldehyde oxidoreductase n=1 Tax=Amycolatopsis camponoti TaxID=2606593 RepID=A0A6I8LS44_9PSEU|nr:xanthine dehydrogenase family protein molybdopterin-binding subunit [Amycolatopsis camponoti]VVJ18435.1 Periplasmic aromatic aldehyde oxidoreductase [Amycolatopsis camponoti]
MSLMQRVVGLVARALPDRAPDPMLDRKDAFAGTPLSRVDGPLKVTGGAEYTADVAVPGLTHAAMVCSTIAGGRIESITVADAEKAAGVVLVMTYRNAPVLSPAPTLMSFTGASFTDAPMMQDARVRWDGEPIAVVVAETLAQARHAASLVKVTYAEDPSARVDFDALKSRARRPAAVQGQRPRMTKGSVDEALRTGDVVVDHVYRTPRHNHAAIEPHATAVAWHGDDSMTVWDSTQAVTHTQMGLAKVFGLEREKVRVVSQFVGGGFGNKMMWNHQVLCAAAAKLSGRPVRITMSREDVFRVTGGRTLSEQRVALSATRHGKLSALVHEGTTTIGVDGNGFAEQFTFPARVLYAADNFVVDQRVLELNMVPNASMRAPGESIGSFALESAVDEVAEGLGMDPIEFRRGVQPDKNPSSGRPFAMRNLMRAYDLGAARFGWDARNPVPRSHREGEWWIGHGVASCNYPYVRLPGAKASVRIDSDGHAVVRTAAHEMGMGTPTVQVQHAAARLGLPVEQVRFEYGDSELPAGIPAGGSAQTVAIIASVTDAVDKLVKELLKLTRAGSPISGARPRQVELRDGGIYRKDGGPGISYRELLRAAGRDHVEAVGAGSLPLEMMKHSMESFGAQFCEVRVSDVTGEVRVNRWVGSFDTGLVLNPKTAASQFRGGIVMGLGQALTEETAFDTRRGRIMNPSLAHYHVPVHADVPPIDVVWLDIPDPLAPMGAHGVGEIGVVGVAGAVANAVYNAIGVRFRELPLTPGKVLSGLAALEAESREARSTV